MNVPIYPISPNYCFEILIFEDNDPNRGLDQLLTLKSYYFPCICLLISWLLERYGTILSLRLQFRNTDITISCLLSKNYQFCTDFTSDLVQGAVLNYIAMICMPHAVLLTSSDRSDEGCLFMEASTAPAVEVEGGIAVI